MNPQQIPQQRLSIPSEDDILDRVENEIAAAQLAGSQGASTPYSAAMFGAQQKQNLVEWQLDFSSELQEIERLLRSDVLEIDKKSGREVWTKNRDPSKRLFNEIGVQDMLRFIYTLVNKNKVLSNYDPDEIRLRVQLIKHELRIQIYNNYEIYGIDNDYKMNNYPMIVHTIGSLIEDAYRRAMWGDERKDLNQARMVQQSEPISPNVNNFYPMAPQQKKKHWYNPFSWAA